MTTHADRQTVGATLEVNNLRVNYGDFAAVRGMSFAVAPGAAVGVVGANGAGKSSLFRAIAGLQPASGGVVTFNGHPIRGRKAWNVARAGLQLVPEGREIFAGLTVRENLEVGAMRLPRSDRAQALEEMLEVFPRLRERAGQVASSLSGGEQQMLAVARACVAKPSVLMLDEPSLGLAPLVIRDLRAALAKIRASGMSVLIADQGLGIVKAFCEEVHVCRLGELIASGPVEILNGEVLSDAFLT